MTITLSSGVAILARILGFAIFDIRLLPGGCKVQGMFPSVGSNALPFSRKRYIGMFLALLSVSVLSTAVLIASGSFAEAVEDPSTSTLDSDSDSQIDTSPYLRDSIEASRKSLAEKFFGVELSAFGDAFSFYDDTGNQKMKWGAFELDATADLIDDFQASVAVLNDSTGLSIPVSFIDYNTSGGRIAPRGRLWVEKGFHVQLGRFDVPFGNDWQFFASKDSVSISRPFTTDLVMNGGYNDEGMRALGNDGSYNFNVFVLRGFNAGHLVGTRLGMTPFGDPFSFNSARDANIFELGLSYFYDGNSSWRKNEVGEAVDAEIRMNDWLGRFEYMTRKQEALPDAERIILRGWHYTQEYSPDEMSMWPTTLFARYEQGVISPPEIATLGPEAGDERDVRVTAGFKTNLGGSDVVQWKFEVQHYLKTTPTTREMPGFGRSLFWYTQFVVVL